MKTFRDPVKFNGEEQSAMNAAMTESTTPRSESEIGLQQNPAPAARDTAEPSANKGSGTVGAGPGKPRVMHPLSCPDAERMGEHACENKAQCWEPCGELGKSEAHVRVASPEASAAVDAALANGCHAVGTGFKALRLAASEAVGEYFNGFLPDRLTTAMHSLRDALVEVQKIPLQASRREVARWMIANGYATGHGDTLDDLLQHLVGESKERHSQVHPLDAKLLRRVASDVQDGFGDLLTTEQVISIYEAVRDGIAKELFVRECPATVSKSEEADRG